MKGTLSDKLLFVARSLLVLVFVISLTIAVVGYCYILPDRVISFAFRSYGVLETHVAGSKERIFCSSVLCSVTFLLAGFLAPYIMMMQRWRTNQSTDYWNREENLALKSNITGICLALICGMVILYVIRVQIGYFSFNLSPPHPGEAVPLFERLIAIGILFGVSLIFRPLTLILVKCYRERRQHFADVVPSEPQV